MKFRDMNGWGEGEVIVTSELHAQAKAKKA